MNEVKRPKTGIHGFFSVFDFIKATLSLGVTVSALVSAVVVYAVGHLDERYAPIEVVAQVRYANELSTQALKKLMRREVEVVESQLCSSETTHAHRRDLNRRKGEMLEDYRRLFQTDPYIPPCDET